ncbi:Cytochrome c551 peroxidase [Arcticibacter svalbardensis MN12-7]|uniref:Methylamine utilization protein MauG n=1 Tax=Arcticibacter svalbardensis MN12-7 TaxID=1150600 RepID=R9GP40_9SPHI|nr:cytochrome c peroxidase [Arcticibacter svalbardensis]EOR93486.1 Cytochrome c551 peroxidase [Arcticibacter svalbardensis MN12-7]
MKKILAAISLFMFFLFILSFQSFKLSNTADLSIDSLREIYSQSPENWPKPFLDPGVEFNELGQLPKPPFTENTDSVKGKVKLGKMLFFDPRLSGSNQISCSSCHAPDLNWTDGREVSIGHGHMANTRNAQSVQNIWFFKRLFWDGRAASLEEQATGPIGSDIEMHQEIKALPRKLKKIKGYEPLFAEAFGDKKVTEARILKALATYQITLVSRQTDFDYFLQGNKKRMTDQQILGLHLFRTKARCMNCHNGPLFTDGGFHNEGLTYYGRDKFQDLGLYNVTKVTQDVGKFKTPGLRDVMRTGPWFHNGLFGNIDGVMNMYNAGMARPKPKPEQLNDPLFPRTDPLLQKLNLSKEERDALVAFLRSITTEPWKVRQPVLPQ